MFIKKEDPHMAFFIDTIEPVCIAYEHHRFGEMFGVLGGRTPAIRSHSDKVAWTNDMNALLTLRSTNTIGAVLDYLRQTKRPRLSGAVESRERETVSNWDKSRILTSQLQSPA